MLDQRDEKRIRAIVADLEECARILKACPIPFKGLIMKALENAVQELLRPLGGLQG